MIGFYEKLSKMINKGDILVASPFLEDTNFEKSVILITECNDTGHIGFVLNKVLEISLNDVLSTFVLHNELPLFYGGPVSQNALFYIHSLGDIRESMPITPTLYWGGDFEQVQELIRSQKATSNTIRFFAGYAGWSLGQLEQEIEEKAWIVQRYSPLVMKLAPETMWKDKIRRMNNEYAYWANIPTNPSLN